MTNRERFFEIMRRHVPRDTERKLTDRDLVKETLSNYTHSLSQPLIDPNE